MRCLPAVLAVLVTAATLAGPAQAEQGTGLYAPFPSPQGGARAERFVGQLGVNAKTAQLERGVDLDRHPAPAVRAAGVRAGVGVPAPRGALIGVLALAAVAATLAVTLAVRR